MKKIIITTFIISTISLLISCTAFCVVLDTKRSKEKTIQEIFNEAVYSVAELKSNFGDESEYGTAVLISDNGLYATNAHLVLYENGGEIKEFDSHYIRFAFEEEYHIATLYKYNYEQDIAYLKMEDDIPNTKPISISNNIVYYGDVVYAVGNGMNHGIGISKGIVSVPLTTITTGTLNRNVIQCDLNINSGNSGGALLNSKCELLGITSFRLKASDGSVIYGTSYAIPYNQFLEVLNS